MLTDVNDLFTGMVQNFTGMVNQFSCIVNQTVDRAVSDRICALELAVIVAVFALSLLGGCFQLAVFFQLGQQEDADQRCCKAAVIQAEAAVEIGHGSYQQIMQESCNDTLLPAILIRNGAGSMV